MAKQHHQEVTTGLGPLGTAVEEGEREGSGPPGRHRRREELDLGHSRDIQVGGPAG